jgi:hypothetical protein
LGWDEGSKRWPARRRPTPPASKRSWRRPLAECAPASPGGHRGQWDSRLQAKRIGRARRKKGRPHGDCHTDTDRDEGPDVFADGSAESASGGQGDDAGNPAAESLPPRRLRRETDHHDHAKAPEQGRLSPQSPVIPASRRVGTRRRSRLAERTAGELAEASPSLTRFQHPSRSSGPAAHAQSLRKRPTLAEMSVA